MKLKFLFVLFSVLTALSASADVRYVGNAGTGVLVDGRPYLLDLYEVDLLEPQFDLSIQPNRTYVEMLAQLDILTPQELNLLALKLTEIRSLSPQYADTLVLATSQYVWRLINSALVKLPDDSPVDVENKTVQLANRYGPYVRIAKTYWEQMTSSNRVALVLHEMISATTARMPAEKLNQPYVDTALPRHIVAYIFLPEFKKRGVAGFQSFSGIPWALSKIINKKQIMAVRQFLRVQPSQEFFKGAMKEFYDFTILQGDLSYDIYFCSLAAQRVKEVGSFQIPLSYTADIATITFETYESTFGPQSAANMNFQYLPAMAPAYPLRKTSFTKADAENCEGWLNKQVTYLFNSYGVQQNVFPNKIR